MAKNKTLDIIDRLKRLEDKQAELAQTKVNEAAAQGETITLEEAQAPTVVNRIYGEIPTGNVNGVNTVFTIAEKALFRTENITLSGCKLRRGVDNDYTMDYATKTIVMNYAPETGDLLEIDYDFDLNGN
jgi:hypothetical protein